MSDDAPEQEEKPEAQADAEAEAPEAPPRRKKKRRKVEEEAEPAKALEGPLENAPARPARPEAPAFARGFPRDPALDALVAAFEAGDYARVRREAPALARSTDRDEVRAAARELRRRLDPDPLASYLLGIAAVLLVFLAGYYWLHPHTH